MCIRRPIPAEEVLASTLRILATGETFRSAHFQFRHGETTVQRYFRRVCRALYTVLKDQYMQVCNSPMPTVIKAYCRAIKRTWFTRLIIQIACVSMFYHF